MNQIIVTMTSWKKRIDSAAVAICYFFDNQTIKPSQFYLWLSKEEFPNREADLPSLLLTAIKTYKINLEWLDGNEKCFKRWKVYPKHFDDCVIVIDDDCYYPPTLIQDVIQQVNRHPNAICNLWWQFSAIPIYDNDITFKFAYSSDEIRNDIWMCGNCAIPPNVFPLDALNDEIIQYRNDNLNGNDEVWLKPFIVKHRIPITYISKTKNYQFKTILTSQDCSMVKENQSIKTNYSKLDIRVYNMLKITNQLDDYVKIYPGYNYRKYEQTVV